MSYELQVRRAAELDIAKVQVWYESRQKRSRWSVPLRSLTCHRLAETPLIYQIAHRDVRRAIVRRFPYLIWYRVLGKTVTVLACTYAGHDPEKVKARLR